MTGPGILSHELGRRLIACLLKVLATLVDDELGEPAIGLRKRVSSMSGHDPERITAAMLDALGRRLDMPHLAMLATIRPTDDAPEPFHPEAPPDSQPPKNSGLGRNTNNINHLP